MLFLLQMKECASVLREVVEQSLADIGVGERIGSTAKEQQIFHGRNLQRTGRAE